MFTFYPRIEFVYVTATLFYFLDGCGQYSLLGYIYVYIIPYAVRLIQPILWNVRGRRGSYKNGNQRKGVEEGQLLSRV